MNTTINQKVQDLRLLKIAQTLKKTVKFAVDSVVDDFKGVTGPKKLHIVQERLKDPPTSLHFNNCKKSEDVKLVEEMQIKVEEMLEDMELKQQNKASAICVDGKEPLNKEPNEGSRKSDILEPEKKRIFFRSRL